MLWRYWLYPCTTRYGLASSQIHDILTAHYDKRLLPAPWVAQAFNQFFTSSTQSSHTASRSPNVRKEYFVV